MKILISLVGEQPTPNLIPLFDKKVLAGPEEGRWGAVKFLVSTDTKKVGKNLLQALASDKATQPLTYLGLTII